MNTEAPAPANVLKMALYLPDYPEPIGSLSFPENAELSGVRMCVGGKMYDAIVTSDKTALVFEEEKDPCNEEAN